MSSRKRAAEFDRIRTTVTAWTDTHPRLTIAANDLNHDDCAPKFLSACRNMQDSRPGSPGAASYDGPSVTGGSGADIVDRYFSGNENSATNDLLDPSAQARGIVDDMLGTLARDLRGLTVGDDVAKRVGRIITNSQILRNLVVAWTPRQATDKDRRAVTVANDEAWCAHHKTAGHMEPTHRVGTVGGNLNVPMPLCLACHNQVRRNGKLPSADWIERRARSGKDDKVRI